MKISLKKTLIAAGSVSLLLASAGAFACSQLGCHPHPHFGPWGPGPVIPSPIPAHTNYPSSNPCFAHPNQCKPNIPGVPSPVTPIPKPKPIIPGVPTPTPAGPTPGANAALIAQDDTVLTHQIEGATAQAAAIGSLFQPYSVGKFNVTAGYGHFKAADAAAAGVGYRFNEHMAARVNASWDDQQKSTAVGAGVDYEF